MFAHRFRLAPAFVFVLMLLIPVRASAAKVGGNLAASDGKPLAARQLHFQGRISGDIFLVRTGVDGTFSVDLPSGDYDLRTESGAMVRSNIVVRDSDLSLGEVREPAGFNPLRLFHREGVVRGIVGSPAPSTANIPAVDENAAATEAPASLSSEAAPQASTSTTAK